MFEEIVNSCNYLLHNYHGAQDSKSYLDGRLNNDVQQFFKFGYFPPINELKLLIDLIGEDILIKSGLITHRVFEDSLSQRDMIYSYFDNFPLILPFNDAYGNIVGLVGRTLLSQEEMKNKKISKYKNSSEKHNPKFKKGNHLFGLFENKKNIMEKNCVFVVEGQFDVIKAYEKGFNNVVALSNSNMTQYQISLITRYTDNIFLLLDNDEAGEKGRKRIVDMFGKYANINNFYLPMEYKDIDEYLTNNSYEDISFIIKD